jgi:hypothetical protein
MLTKVGQSQRMLICTDCGQPVDQRESSAMARQRLWGALTLISLTVVSGAMLLLATMYESRNADAVRGSLDKPEDASGEEARKGEETFLLEPSTLVKPSARGFSETRRGSDAAEETGAPPRRAPALSESPGR